MYAAAFGARRAGAAILGGLVWAQSCIAVRLAVLPRYIALSDSITGGGWYRLASWTLLAPVTLAAGMAPVPATAARGTAATELSFAALLVCPALAVSLWLCAWQVLASPKARRPGAYCLAAVGVFGIVCGGVVTLQLRDAVLAERTFFAMVAPAETPHTDEVTVSAAREFAERHPHSRWAGEALRIVAMSEWDAGRFEACSESWGRFALRFSDRTAPGVAYAEYNIALCDERLGNDWAARRRLRSAIEVIRARHDGIQAWIASDASARLAALERTGGRYALASYWKTKSRTFADVYSTE